MITYYLHLSSTPTNFTLCLIEAKISTLGIKITESNSYADNVSQEIKRNGSDKIFILVRFKDHSLTLFK